MLSNLLFTLRSLLRRQSVESELHSELQFHFDHQVQKFEAAGLSLQEANRRAKLLIGTPDAIKEQCREARRTHLVESTAQDIRYALRILSKSPGFTAVAILTLALGIGVNTSIFSLIYSLAVRTLPVKNPASIVNIYENFRGHFSRGVDGAPSFSSYPEYLSYRDASHSFTGLAAYADLSLSPASVSASPVSALLTSCNYFAILEGDISAGRGLAPKDCRTPGETAVALLSYPYWQTQFGADPAILGKTLTLNRQLFTIIGIAAENFSGTEIQVPDVWIPITMAPRLMPDNFPSADWLARGNLSWLKIVGRLNAGVSAHQAQAELAVIARQNDSLFPGRETSVIVNSGSYLNSPEVRTVGGLAAAGILAIAVFILVIACINLMSLLLARATTRYQEIGVRLALGAGRSRLIRQLLTESILLSLIGGSAGMLVARWLPNLLLRTVVPEMPSEPRINMSPNFAILLYAFLASLIAAVACGLAPALQSTKLDLVSALKQDSSPSGAGSSTSRLRNLIGIAQIAGCSVLLIAAGLLVRGIHRAESSSPGYLTKNILVVSLDLSNNGYSRIRAAAFERDLINRVAALPTVAGVARSAILPGVTQNFVTISIPGSKSAGNEIQVSANVVSPEYFQTMGIALLQGRSFMPDESTSTRAASAAISSAVISFAMSRAFWPDGNSIGKTFVAQNTTYQIIGIAPDVQNSHLGQTDGPFFYASNSPDADSNGVIFVRTTADSATIQSAIHQITRTLDPSVRVSTETLEQALAAILAPSKTIALMVAVLGILAMLLAVVGVSGMVAYAATQRTREIGIRMALGAQPTNIAQLLLTQAIRQSIIGLAVGIAIAAVASQLLNASSLLFGLDSLDPLIYSVTALSLAAVTLAASYIPVRRATHSDPLSAFRHH